MSNADTRYWQESKPDTVPGQSVRAVDVSFRLNCPRLKVDHTVALHAAIHDVLPWFYEHSLCGLHPIHVAGSQNGWQRPTQPDALLHLSRRTRLVLRVTKDMIQEAQALVGAVLDIDGYRMTIGEATEKPILASNILFSRQVIANDTDNEQEFLASAATQLQQLGIHFDKLLPGKQLHLHGPDGMVKTRSLMVANINLTDSFILQEQGLGGGRSYGCGLFIHHKGIKAVNSDDND